MKNSVFLDKTLYSLESQQKFALLAANFMLGSSSTLRKVTTCSSRKSVDFQWNTWHDIPKDKTL